MEVTIKRIECSVCRFHGGAWEGCRECHGVGYFEKIERDCNGKYSECPISYDPMCDGWECTDCGRSGPYNPTPYLEMYAKIDRRRAENESCSTS